VPTLRKPQFTRGSTDGYPTLRNMRPAEKWPRPAETMIKVHKKKEVQCLDNTNALLFGLGRIA